jgi:hypothetical protein
MSGKMNVLEIVGLVLASLLALLQPVALTIIYYPYKSTQIDTVAAIDTFVCYVLGLYAFVFCAITVGKLTLKESNGSEDRWFFLISAIVFGVIGIPALVFNLIELLSHSEMFHLHIDLITAVVLLLDLILGLSSSIILGFSYEAGITQKKETNEYQIV